MTRILRLTRRTEAWVLFPKISKARDGLREAHRDMLVAVFGKMTHTFGRTSAKEDKKIPVDKNRQISYNKAI